MQYILYLCRKQHSSMETNPDRLRLPEPAADIADRIKYLIKFARMTQAQFAERLGVDPAAVSRALKSKRPTDAFINRIIVNFGVSKDWILNGSDVPFPRSTAATPHRERPLGAPVYNIDVTAGTTPLSRMFTDERIAGYVSLPGINPDCPIVRVSGNSMSPRLNPGCYISIRPVNPAGTISWGQIYVVVLSDYRVVKYVRRHPDPEKVILHSENPDYDDIEVRRADIEGMYLVENIINHDFIA